MTPSKTIFSCFIFWIFSTISQDVIWYEPMNTTISSTEWIINADIDPKLHISSHNCPLRGDCWELCSQNNYQTAFIYKTASTVGYTDVYLKFDIILHGMSNENEFCSFSYNVDNNGDSDWIQFYRYTLNEVELIDQIIELNDTSTYDNIGVGIKILATNSVGDCCWLSNVYLMGTPIINNLPSTNTPITFNPITNMPSSPSPITSVPITNEPTTYTPITNYPTSNQPTITPTYLATTTRTIMSAPPSSPTLISTSLTTSTDDTTRYILIEEDAVIDQNNSQLFIIIICSLGICLCILTIVVIVMFVRQKRNKKNYHKPRFQIASHVQIASREINVSDINDLNDNKVNINQNYVDNKANLPGANNLLVHDVVDDMKEYDDDAHSSHEYNDDTNSDLDMEPNQINKNHHTIGGYETLGNDKTEQSQNDEQSQNEGSGDEGFDDDVINDVNGMPGQTAEGDNVAMPINNQTYTLR